MPELSRTILGPAARRRKPAAARARRAPPVPPAPAEPPAPVAQRGEQPPAAPAKGADTIKAIVIDPAKRSVKEVRLAIEPGDPENGFGTQIANDAVEKIVGSDAIEALDLRPGEVVLVDALRQSETVETWRFGGDDETISGPGVIVAYDPAADAYTSTEMTLGEVRQAVVFDDADQEGADDDPTA
jgi:hypothetical protein